MAASGATASLGLVVSADCNLRCAYCYQDRKQPRHMSWATMSRALDLLTSSNRRRADVTFLGGEPLLGFPLIVRAVRRLGRRFSAKRRPDYVISTNGLLLTPRRLAFLERHRFDIQLSFDGVAPSQDLRSPGSFAVLDRLLDRLSLRHRAYFRRRVMVAVTVTAPAIPHLADSFDYLLAKGVEDIAIGPAMGHPRLSKAQAGELDRQFGRIFTQSWRHYRETGTVPLRLFRKPAPAPRKPEGATGRASRRPGGTSRSTWTERSIRARCSFARARPWRGRARTASGGDEPRARHRSADGLQQRRAKLPDAAMGAGIFGPQSRKRSGLAAARRAATRPRASSARSRAPRTPIRPMRTGFPISSAPSTGLRWSTGAGSRSSADARKRASVRRYSRQRYESFRKNPRRVSSRSRPGTNRSSCHCTFS